VPDTTAQQVDARLVVDARVEEHVVAHELVERRRFCPARAAVAAPVIRHRAAAVRNDQRSVGKSLNRSDIRSCMKAVVSALM
jgi:hypothetical protein